MWRALSMTLFACTLAGPGAARAWGQWEQIHKLTADDAEALDEFGTSVSISGDVAIVGARFDDDAGESSGSAYLFDVTTGEQLHKLTADDGTTSDNFGRSVGISGGIAIVGASGNDDAGDFSGSAYLFDVASGVQLDKLTADDAAALDGFGFSVAISGGIAIIGAVGDDDAGSGSGSAYLFDVATGQQLHKLTADDAAAQDFFGFTVAMSGAIAIVGAHGDDDAGSDSGSAYLFDVITGQQLHKLTADDAEAVDFFGNSVAISGDVAIVGARFDDDAGNSSGSAYLFDVATGQQLHKLTADDDAAGHQFGISVAISGDIAIVGAWLDVHAGNSSGSAYLLDVATGQQLHKLTADDAAFGDQFGFSVAMSGDIAIVGAWRNDDAGSNSGSAYVFEQSLRCPADLNGDGAVEAADLAILLGAWGLNPDHPADFNGDDVVNAADLAILLGNWGPCL